MTQINVFQTQPEPKGQRAKADKKGTKKRDAAEAVEVKSSPPDPDSNRKRQRKRKPEQEPQPQQERSFCWANSHFL